VTGVSIVVFELDGCRYGLRSADVDSVCQNVAVTPLPEVPALVEGVIDVHGRVIPVLDLRARIGLEPRRATLQDHLILTCAGDREVALRVDRAVDLVDVDAASIQPAAALLDGGELATGIAKLPDGLVVIHDLGAFLDADQSAALARAVANVEEA